MTHRVSTRGRMAETDCNLTQSTVVVGCSPKQCSLADDSLVLNIPTVRPHRGQSLRLNAMNDIYKAEDAISSTTQRTSGEKSSSSNNVEVESISTLDDLPINITLKDLQKRGISRKRKALKLFASSTSDIQSSPVKPKEEEPDLDEPLILMKLKRPNKPSIGRKQRKRLHISESIIPVEETIIQLTDPSFCYEGSSPIITERSSSAKEVVAEDGSDNIPESVNDNLVVTSDKDPLHVCGPDLSYTFKREIVETYDASSSSSSFIDNSNTLGGPFTVLSQKVCEEESADGVSHSSTNKFLHPCVTGNPEMAFSCSSPSTASHMAASLLLNITQSDKEVKSEGAESDSRESRSESFVYVSSDLDYIGKNNGPGNSSSELCEIIDRGESDHGGVTSFTTKNLDCCTGEESLEFMETDGHINLPERNGGHLDNCSVNEVSIESMEPDNLADGGEECHEEKTALESSERSSDKLLSSFSKPEMPTLCADNYQLVSATTDPSLYLNGRLITFNSNSEEVMHVNIMSQLGNLDITHIQEHVHENNSIKLRREECHNQSDDRPVPKMSICNHGSNLTGGHSILNGYIHDRHHSTGFSEEVGSLSSLVHRAIGGDEWRNNSEDHVNSHIDEDLVLGTYDLCDSPQHSSACGSSSCDSHSANVSSKGTESLHFSTMDETLNLNTGKAGNSAYAGELTSSPFESSSAVEDFHSCGPRHPDTSFTSAYAGKSEAKTESLHCSILDQMLNRCSEDEGTSAEIDAEEPVEAFGLHSPQVLPPYSVAVNGLLNVHPSSSEASRRIQSSAADYCASSDMPNLVQEEESKMENELKCIQGMKFERHPKKLLSNRKDLSPTSQEKLRRAFNRNELDDITKIPNRKETEVMPGPEKITKRLKYSMNGSPQSLPKGILKSQDPLDRNCSCSKNSLIHTHAQKAVTFSQRQMQDIENIATKLLKGLSSMKNIVEENIGSEACPSSSSNSEEIRLAVQNASNLEYTTKKWLSMMAKDCNRFCKIMKSTENNAAAALGARRQPKKITFADEAGGLLCHVKVFERLPASFVGPRYDV